MEAIIDSQNSPRRGERSAHFSHWVVLGLGTALGCGLGYLGHRWQVNSASQDACYKWQSAICAGVGEESYACQQAETASTLLLSGSACFQAREGLDGKIAQIKAGRFPCTELSDRLCRQLGPEGEGCALVRSKEPGLSVDDCQDMARNYDQILAQIMSRQTRGTLPKRSSAIPAP